MDGFEFVKRFRSWESESDINDIDIMNSDGKKRFHIIGMSANSDAQSKQAALDVGMDSFITKPFNYNDLLPLLNKNYKIDKNKKL